MATLKDEFELMKARIASGHGGETVHVVWVDREKRARKSPGHKTRFTFDLQSNELYRQVWAEWDRILTQLVNVSVARHIVGEQILASLKGLTPEKLKELAGQDTKTLDAERSAQRTSPPRAEIPDWLKL